MRPCQNDCCQDYQQISGWLGYRQSAQHDAHAQIALPDQVIETIDIAIRICITQCGIRQSAIVGLEIWYPDQPVPMHGDVGFFVTAFGRSIPSGTKSFQSRIKRRDPHWLIITSHKGLS